MNTNEIITELESNRNVFQDLLYNVPESQYMWRPAPNKWCLLEIVCHLHDEEQEDFRARVRHVLATPNQPLPPIDPGGWVSERNYAQQDYEQVLDRFMEERKESIDWLRSLKYPKWDNAYDHPKFGPMSAQLFFTNWLAHDYLHIRQILHLKYEYLKQETGISLAYAGEW